MSKNYQPTSLQHLTAGQPLKISASTWNAIAKHVESSHSERDIPMKSSETNTVLLCKNTTGATIPPFTVVALSDFTPNEAWTSGTNYWERMGVAYQSTPIITTDWDEKAVLGISQHEIADGECGYVVISGYSILGVTPSKSYGTEYPAYTNYLVPCSNGYLLYTKTFGPIRLLKRIGGVTNLFYVQINPPFYEDFNVLGVKWTFNRNVEDNVVTFSITITTQKHHCFVYDEINHRYYYKEMPAMSLTTGANSLAYNQVSIRYNIQTEEFELVTVNGDSAVNPRDSATYAYVSIGYIDNITYKNTINSTPVFVFYDVTQYSDVENLGFRLYLPSLTDKWERVLIGKGLANVPAKDKTHMFNGGGSVEKDCFNQNFVAGNIYVVMLKYTFSTDSFSFLAVPRSNAFDNDFLPSTTHAVATIGMFKYRYYIRQWHHAASISLYWKYSKYDNP